MVEPVITAGALIISAFVSTVGLILVAKINNVGKKVDTAVELSQPTGNGYAETTTRDLEILKRSVGALHARFDEHMNASSRHANHVDHMLINFDDRLTEIEDKIA